MNNTAKNKTANDDDDDQGKKCLKQMWKNAEKLSMCFKKG